MQSSASNPRSIPHQRNRFGIGVLSTLLFVLIELPISAAETSESQPVNYTALMGEVRDAFSSDNWELASDRLAQVRLLRPYSTYTQRLQITALAQAGNREDVLKEVRSLADRGLTVDFDWLKSLPNVPLNNQFEDLQRQLAQNALPFGQSNPIFESNATDLLPEAIAVNEKGDVFIGSVRNGEILVFRKGGEKTTLCQLPGGVYDLELRGDRLWAAYNPQTPFVGPQNESPRSGIAQIDIVSGNISNNRLFPESGTLIGDIELDSKGILYASDSLTPRIWILDTRQDKPPSAFVQNDRFVNLQGLALDDYGNRLFVADYLVGLFMIEIDSERVTELANPSEAHLGGIDGLYLGENYLYGIQNGTQPQRIIQLELYPESAEIRSLKVLQQAQPFWTEPTHGAIWQDSLLYIATSNWPSYDDEGNILADIERKPLQVQRLNFVQD